MRRLNHNLAVAVAVVGLTLVGSVAMAAGVGRSAGFGGARSFAPSRSVSGVSHTQTFVPLHGPVSTFARVNPPNNPVPPIVPLPHPHCPPYHMWYPVVFWFGGHYDVADVVEAGIDVQFTSIRQLDAGDPAKNLAPAYRVWFTNNTDADINQPFDISILASNTQTLTQNLPYSAVRVNGIAALETTYVDIRLPIEAMTMNTSGGQAGPYAYLHTIIDSQNELVETNKVNNYAVFARQDIPMLGN